MPQDFRIVAGKNKKGRNKQGSFSQPRRAWKEIADLLYEREGAHYERPPATTRPLTKTGRARKRMDTQEREARNAARERNKAERAARSEHERRSEAARKGWAKIPKEERTRRAEKGWETRDRKRGQYSPEPRRAKRARAHPMSIPF